MTVEPATFDPEDLHQKSLLMLAELEGLRDAAKRARRKLERARNADEYLACFLQAKGALIAECLALEVPLNTIAEVILRRATDTPINRKKLLAAVKRCALPTLVGGGTPRKRIGRPPKNQDATTNQQAGQDAATAVAVSATQTVIATAKNTATATTVVATPPPAQVQKTVAKSEKPVAPASTGPKDKPEREQRMRSKAPVWAMDYSDHRKYAPVVARREGESDADYFWRMWHAAPPWSSEVPRFADQITETQWIEKCWLYKSPEERAAHQASLPTTAR
jgi:hypothetical protein